MFLDNNPAACARAEEEGFRVVFGNVIEERTLRRAQLEDRAICLAMTPNEEVNLIWARTAVEHFGIDKVHVACRRDRNTVTRAIVEQAEASVLFAHPRDLDLWAIRFRRGIATIESWRFTGAERESPAEDEASDKENDKTQDAYAMPENLILPLLVRRGKKVTPVHSGRPLKSKDVVELALFGEAIDEAQEWLRQNSFEPEEA